MERENIREIKYRAMTFKTPNKWVYGYIYPESVKENRWYIVEEITGSHIRIIKKTGCECTGLKDKKDKEIYEGDILAILDKRCKQSIIEKVIVEFDSCYEYRDHEYGDLVFTASGLIIESEKKVRKMEIIGNIYENPELLRSN